MNAPALRGLAILALLCLLPRAGALTVTQQSTDSFYNSTTGFILTSGTTWKPFLPDPALTLQAIYVSAEISVTVEQNGLNLYGQPFTYTPSVSAGINAFVVGPAVSGFTLISVTESFSENQITLQVGQGHSTSHTFLSFFNYAPLSQSVWNLFSPGNPPTALNLSILAAGSNPSFGAVTTSGQIAWTLSYQYGVPDVGSSITFSAIAVGLCFLVHFRNIRGRQTL
ncbi:hypothetical protein [Horticoccus sp. 23ND18S-11]|uniref:hypothetical protein n=1 Tax=Horticoccus sp. 23ND18S-11 TaxID=3391832 RepID=UPI0039C94C22